MDSLPVVLHSAIAQFLPFHYKLTELSHLHRRLSPLPSDFFRHDVVHCDPPALLRLSQLSSSVQSRLRHSLAKCDSLAFEDRQQSGEVAPLFDFLDPSGPLPLSLFSLRHLVLSICCYPAMSTEHLHFCLEKIVQSCPLLVSLDWESPALPSPPDGEKGLPLLGQLPHLRRLVLRSWRLSSSTLRFLFQGLPLLEELGLHTVVLHKAVGPPQTPPAEGSPPAVTTSSRMRSLQLQHTDLRGVSAPLKALLDIQLCEASQGLEKLLLPSLCDDGLITSLLHCRHLRVLQMDFEPSCATATLESIVDRFSTPDDCPALPCLEDFTLNRMISQRFVYPLTTAEALQRFVAVYHRQLRGCVLGGGEVGFGDPWTPRDPLTSFLSELPLFDCLCRCTALQSLAVCWRFERGTAAPTPHRAGSPPLTCSLHSSPPGDAPRLPPVSPAARSLALRSLEFGHKGAELSSERLTAVLERLPHLEELSIAGASTLSVHLLQRVGQHCPLLRVLRITELSCPESPEGTDVVSASSGRSGGPRALSALGSLTFIADGSAGMSASTIARLGAFLAHHAPALAFLDLGHCNPHIPAAVLCAFSRLVHLRGLRIRGVADIDRAGVWPDHCWRFPKTDPRHSSLMLPLHLRICRDGSAWASSLPGSSIQAISRRNFHASSQRRGVKELSDVEWEWMNTTPQSLFADIVPGGGTGREAFFAHLRTPWRGK